MSFFRRRPAGAPDESITAFWDWWQAEGRAAAEEFLTGTDDTFVPALTAHLDAVGGLGWQLAPGESGRVLVLSGQGDPEARPVARRLALAAPPADHEWSYADVRPAHPDPDSVVLATEGPDVDLRRVQVSARVSGRAFDVQVHHPAFPDLPDAARARATAEALVSALGEVDAALWLGEVTPVELPPLDGFGLSALRSVVHDLRRQQLDPEGRPRWVMMRGETGDGVLLALVRSPLHPLTAPHLDTYVSVALPYPHEAAGLPDEAGQSALQEWQDRLEDQLGESGQVVAHLTHAGTRTVHLYVDSTAGLVTVVRKHARDWGQGGTAVHEMSDPDWQAVAHLRG